MSHPAVNVSHQHWEGTRTQLQVNLILSFPPLVILYYDYLLTLSREVRWFWPGGNKRSKFGVFGFVFLANRYIPIVGSLPVLFVRSSIHDDTLRRFQHIPYVAGIDSTSPCRPWFYCCSAHTRFTKATGVLLSLSR
ncbi:hypothetical protein BC834DRAFT_259551 [Gloeopeniophorella convolvens]|nr:hypothetical protein BC834DRAFT_259551 [Gloeopeniophorella convolvens]